VKKSVAHITGGGLLDNIPRTLPDGLGVSLNGSWNVPAVIKWLVEQGPVERDEALRTFNMGVGMTLVVDAGEADRLRRGADLLMIHHSDIPRGERSVELTDPISGEAVKINLDPSLGPIENAQRLYTRAKRLTRGRPRVVERLSRIEEEITALKGAIDRYDRGEEVEPPSLLVRQRPVGKRAEGVRSTVIGGYTVLIGRNAAENDRILREASPDDVWPSGLAAIMRHTGT